MDHLIPEYISALCTELIILSQSQSERLPVHTVFFGGGTPSLIRSEYVESILATINNYYELLTGSEITIEANPGSLTQSYLSALVGVGFNRLSLGMQSANTWELQLLEREHDFGDVIRSVHWARQAGFENINLDLIFGLPDQEIHSWKTSLESAVGLEPEHISLYSLTLEHGTPLLHWVNKGLVAEPDADIAAEMYEYSMDRLSQAGYIKYEISNWAKPNQGSGLLSCSHNLQYLRNQPYLGVGAGAHGFAGGLRVANVLAPMSYIQRFSRVETNAGWKFPLTPATATSTPVSRDDEIAETMLMGLRLTQEGVSQEDFSNRFGKLMQDTYAQQIADLLNKGLVEWGGEQGNKLRLTRQGRLLGNQVFIQFI